MFRLASFDLSGRRILVVEDEDGVAAKMAQEIEQCGGIAMGIVASIDAAVEFVRHHSQIDCAMLDVRQIVDAAVPVMSTFRDLAVEVVFVTGHDDWYLNYE